MDRVGALVFAFGHSHHARIWRKVAQLAVAELLPSDSTDMQPDSRYMLNVGTTGLPFPGKGGPSVAVVDFETGRLRQLALERS
jgi:hypothetical protein